MPSREPTRRSTPWLTLLALLSFAIAALIWGVSLAQSVERPSVGNALEQRQLELEVLASRQGDSAQAAEEQLLQALQQSPEAGSSDSLIAQALLEQRLEHSQRSLAQLSPSPTRRASGRGRPSRRISTTSSSSSSPKASTTS